MAERALLTGAEGSKQVSTNKNAFLSAWACVGVAVEEPENKSEL